MMMTTSQTLSLLLVSIVCFLDEFFGGIMVVAYLQPSTKIACHQRCRCRQRRQHHYQLLLHEPNWQSDRRKRRRQTTSSYSNRYFHLNGKEENLLEDIVHTTSAATKIDFVTPPSTIDVRRRQMRPRRIRRKIGGLLQTTIDITKEHQYGRLFSTAAWSLLISMIQTKKRKDIDIDDFDIHNNYNNNAETSLLQKEIDDLHWLLHEPGIFWEAATRDAVTELGHYYDSTESYVEALLANISNHDLVVVSQDGIATQNNMLEEDDDEDEPVRDDDEDEKVEIADEEMTSSRSLLPLHERYIERGLSGTGHCTLLISSNQQSSLLQSPPPPVALDFPPFSTSNTRFPETTTTHLPVFLKPALVSSPGYLPTQILAESIYSVIADMEVTYLIKETIELVKTDDDKDILHDLFAALENGNESAVQNIVEGNQDEADEKKVPAKGRGRGKKSDSMSELHQIMSNAVHLYDRIVDNAQVNKRNITPSSYQLAMKSLIQFARRKNKIANIIIDDADLIFNPKLMMMNDGQNDYLFNVLSILHDFSNRRDCNILMVTSNTNFRWELHRAPQIHSISPSLSIDSLFDNVIVTREPSPSQMWDLLVHPLHRHCHLGKETTMTKKGRSKMTNDKEGDSEDDFIGYFGPHLAKLVIAVYGSDLNVYKHVLSDLLVEQDAYWASRRLSVDMADKIGSLLTLEGEEPTTTDVEVLREREGYARHDKTELGEMTKGSAPPPSLLTTLVCDILQELAQNGYARLPAELHNPLGHPAVEALVRDAGLATLVCRTDKMIGFDSEFWNRHKNCRYVLLPTSQSTRLLIAEALYSSIGAAADRDY